MTDAESTSAKLRRIEQERDAAWRFLAVRAGQLDAADAERDNLDRQLAAMLAAAAERVGRLVYSYDAWSCLRCGNRYHRDFADHPCGLLTPVTVTITRRTDEPVAVLDPGEGLLT